MTASERSGLSLPTRLHAALLGVGIAVAVLGHNAAWLGAVALATFTVRIAWERDRWRESGGFGLANGLTALRVVLIAGLAWLPAQTLVPWAGVTVLATFCLDGIDGWVARRSGTTSSFGADFDQEADAFTVAMATLLAYHHGLAGAWFLVPGVLRYLYVGAVWALGAPREAPRSRYGRHAYSLFVVGLIALLILPSAPTHILAAAGTFALCASFARSFWEIVVSR